jgi:hypothetical protein
MGGVCSAPLAVLPLPRKGLANSRFLSIREFTISISGKLASLSYSEAQTLDAKLAVGTCSFKLLLYKQSTRSYIMR